MEKTLAFLQTEMRSLLLEKYNQREVQQLMFMLLETIGVSRVQAIAYPDTKVSYSDYETIVEQTKRVADGEPIQYVLGHEQFMNLTFNVCSGVLIPRPETAELVELIISQQTVQSPAILDIGTGSGCIAVSLAKYIPTSRVKAIDVSTKAIQIAISNAELNGVEVDFLCKSIFDDDFAIDSQSLDIVVSNPPYVLLNEKPSIEANVLNYEPHTALFVPNEKPLLFYIRIADLAKQWLKQGGKLYFEINERFGNETKLMLETKGYTAVEIHKDFYQKDRMVSAIWNGN